MSARLGPGAGGNQAQRGEGYLLLVTCKPHRGINPVAELTDDLVLAIVEEITDPDGVVASGAISRDALFVDGARGLRRFDGSA